MRAIRIVYFLFTVIGMFLLSCSNDSYDIVGSSCNYLSINDNKGNRELDFLIYHTPVGDFGDIKAEFATRLQRPLDYDVLISAEIDNSLVDTYNKDKSDLAVAIPELVANSLIVSPGSIKAGFYEGIIDSVKIEIPKQMLELLPESRYVAPVKLKALSEDLTTSVDFGVAYLVINTTGDYADFLGSTIIRNSVVNTPIGTFGSINANFNVKPLVVMNDNVEVTLEAAMEQVDSFNRENETDYEAMPEDVANALTITPSVIEANSKESKQSVNVKIPESLAGKLQVGRTFLLPLRLVCSANGKTDRLTKYCYIITRVSESMINDNAKELIGKPFDINVAGKEWSLVSSSNFKENTFGNLFKERNGYFAFDHKDKSAECVFNMGTVRKVTGFTFDKIYGTVVNGITVSLSMDGKTWVELGNTQDRNSVYVNRSDWYVLYGAVNAQYIKVDCSLDLNSQGWQSASWYVNYAALCEFNISIEDE